MAPSLIEFTGFPAAALTTLCLIPQAARIVAERDTRAISLTGSATFAAGITLWLVYGVALADWPLIASNIVTLALMIFIIALKLRYDRQG